MVKPPAQSGGVTHWELLLSLVSASDFFQVICSTARWHLQLVALGEGRLHNSWASLLRVPDHRYQCTDVHTQELRRFWHQTSGLRVPTLSSPGWVT